MSKREDLQVIATEGDHIADRWLSRQPVYLTDLDRSQPAKALASCFSAQRWRTIRYETAGFAGTMLVAGPETAAPDITYPLHAAGWYAISLGMYCGDLAERSTIRVRLSSQKTYTYLTVGAEETDQSGDEIIERYWTTADLTGQGLVLGQDSARLGAGDGPSFFRCSPARIAYIKLIPLTDVEKAHVGRDRSQSNTRRLFAHNDAHGFMFQHAPITEEVVRRELEPFRDSDFSRIYWEAGQGDLLYYHSRIGRMPTADGVTDFARVGDRLHVENWRKCRETGLEPIRVAADQAHKLGMEFHACYRVAGFHYPPPIDQWNQASIYNRHPEWRGVDRAGQSTPRLSYAYPEVRALVVSLLREMASFPVDGVCLLYNRRPPMLEYESPLIDAFQREFGQDPRKLDPRNDQWLRFRARTLTQFMREVRTAIDEVGYEQRRMKRLAVSAIVLSSETENLYYGMDLPAWVSERLVDTLIPYRLMPTLESAYDSWTDPRDLHPFVEMVRDAPCTLAPNIMPRVMTPEDLRQRATGLYAAGAEHIFFWDCVPASSRARVSFGPMWDALRRLGHIKELSAWQQADSPALGSLSIPLHRIGDWDLAYATPG